MGKTVLISRPDFLLAMHIDIFRQPASIWCGIWIFSINRRPSGVEYGYLALTGIHLVWNMDIGH